MTGNRKIVQLAATEADGVDTLYAACEDGTVWALGPWRNEKWERLPSIPGQEVPYSDSLALD